MKQRFAENHLTPMKIFNGFKLIKKLAKGVPTSRSA